MKVIRIIILLLFLSPFLILSSHITEMNKVVWGELTRVTGQSLLQAGISATLTIVVSVWVALGLIRIQNGFMRRSFELLIMIPSLLPSLFIVVSVLNLFSLVGQFPFGLWGVILINTFIYVGFISVFIAKVIEARSGALVELATIEGASRSQILKPLLLNLKTEIINQWYVVFVLCFSSFSVPLIVGLDRGETIEVLIYRSLLGRGDLSGAIFYSFIQMLILGILAAYLWRPELSLKTGYRNLKRVSSPLGLMICIGLTVATISANFIDLRQGFLEFAQNSLLLDKFIKDGWGTLIQCFSTVIFLVILLLSVFYILPDNRTEKFLFSYAIPSSAVIGLSVYLLFDSSAWANVIVLVVMAFGFCITVLPTLFRLRGLGSWREIEGQVTMAQLLSAERFYIFRKIIVPQILPDILMMAGWGGFWASGDFALASLISNRELTLAMGAQNFLGGYHIHMATIFTLGALVLGAIVLFIIEVTSRVCYSES